MKKFLKRFSRVADSSAAAQQYAVLQPKPRWRAAGKIPVCVGEDMVRFSVSADVVNHPIFERLLNLAAEEYGYHQTGVIRIPCRVADFRRLLEAVRRGAPEDVVDVIGPLFPEEAD